MIENILKILKLTDQKYSSNKPFSENTIFLANAKIRFFGTCLTNIHIKLYGRLKFKKREVTGSALPRQ